MCDSCRRVATTCKLLAQVVANYNQVMCKGVVVSASLLQTGFELMGGCDRLFEEG